MNQAISLDIKDAGSVDLTLHALHARMATELWELASICGAVEGALGEILANPGKPLDSPVVTLQGLDRLRQSLEDLSRLSDLIANNANKECPNTISADSILATVVLAGLAVRLADASSPEIASDGNSLDVIWG